MDKQTGIIREQGEFMDVKPLSEEDAKILKEAEEKDKENK